MLSKELGGGAENVATSIPNTWPRGAVVPSTDGSTVPMTASDSLPQADSGVIFKPAWKAGTRS